jgi:hypothetical protein
LSLNGLGQEGRFSRIENKTRSRSKWPRAGRRSRTTAQNPDAGINISPAVEHSTETGNNLQPHGSPSTANLNHPPTDFSALQQRLGHAKHTHRHIFGLLSRTRRILGLLWDRRMHSNSRVLDLITETVRCQEVPRPGGKEEHLAYAGIPDNSPALSTRPPESPGLAIPVSPIRYDSHIAVGCLLCTLLHAISFTVQQPKAGRDV